ncbi:hypothetical protein TEA_009077 [Camellia sinensis var. sinensis]|uniref:Uncharacterized protein n=1 Tax=Camellia sinensis var. sinensis TaxID=542762 RepID=A0A4S4DSG1_CAMSN|nr:hypothetical protein TEA_009077 [Camellia sinensis var. sinensis]
MKPILCTQPRRFAVVAVARMVAKARNCEVGGEVGYHIGHSKVVSARYILLANLLMRNFSPCFGLSFILSLIRCYTAFDQLKRRLLRRQLSKKRGTEPSSEALSAFSAFVLGAVSKCIATCLTYPAIRWIFCSVFMKNWCKVMIQAESDEDETKEDQPKAQKTVSGAIHTIWKREGLLGFFKGLQAQILKTVLSSALLMMVKEKITKTTWVLMLALQSTRLFKIGKKTSKFHQRKATENVWSKPSTHNKKKKLIAKDIHCQIRPTLETKPTELSAAAKLPPGVFVLKTTTQLSSEPIPAPVNLVSLRKSEC